MKKIIYIALFLIGANGLHGQIYWNELKDADTIGYVLVSKIDGTFDTVHVSDFYPNFKVQSTVPLNGNKAGDYLFNTLTGDISVWDGDSTFAGTWRTIWDASTATAIQTLSTTGAAGNITLSDGGGTLNLNVDDADASTTNELQTLTESTSFLSVSGSGTSAMSISSDKDRPVSMTFHHLEGATLKPWWAEIENSWYLANERFESVTNTCSIDNTAFFNGSDNFGYDIVDSCTISVIISNSSNGVTYPAGELYFIPYAGSLNDITGDSVKIRMRDRFDDWYTTNNELIMVVDGTGSFEYGYVNVPQPISFIREFEITYYGDIEISELLYFYNRGNDNLPIPSKQKNNIFYRDNTFLGGIGDQYEDFGTDGQILVKDGSGLTYTDQYSYDTTYLYSYIDDLDYWDQITDTLKNESDWSRLQLTDYGTGNYNNVGTEFAMFSSDGTVEGYSIDSIDISKVNEENTNDTYIENGFNERNDNYNFPDYQSNNGEFENNQSLNDLIKLEQIDTDAMGYDVTGVVYDNGYIYIFDNTNNLIKKYNKSYTLLESMASHSSDVEEFIFFNDGLDMIQFTLQNKTIHHYSRSTTDSLAHFTYSGSLNLNTVSNIPITVGNRFHSMFFINDSEFVITEYQNDYKIRFKFNTLYDVSTITYVEHISTVSDITSSFLIGNHQYDVIYDGKIKQYSFNGNFSLSGLTLDTTTASTVFGAAGAFGASWDNEDKILYVASTSPDKITQWLFIGRDTSFTTLPEILDTSNYYSYSVEIEGNNVDTIRTGIATWLDGNVSYQWCTNDTLYTGWYRHELDFKAAEHDSIKPVFVIADTTSIRNVRLFLQQFQADSFDDTAIQERIDSVITVIDDHKTIDLDTDPMNELDNTDDQVFDVATYSSNILSLSLEDDGEATKTFDLSDLLDNTDAQTLVATPGIKTLGITGGNNIDMEELTYQIVRDFFDHASHSGVSVNIDDINNEIDLTSTTLTQEQVQDYIGTMVTGNTETGISVTYDDANDEFDFVVSVVEESTTVGTGFDLSGYQVVADFNEFTTDASPEGDEFIIMYDVSGVTHEKIDIDDLATYIGSGELTTVGTGLSLAGYQINPDFDAFTQDNTFGGTDEVVYLSFTTHKRGTLAGLGAYMQANWGDGTGTDDQAIYYFLSGSTPALRLDGTSTGMEFDAGEGLVSQGFEEGTLDRILYTLDFTELNAITTPVGTDYIVVGRGSDEARMLFSEAASYFSGGDGNGLWDTGNTNSLMGSAMTGYVNNYLNFTNATGSTSILYIDDATTDFVGIRTTTQSNSAYLNVGGPVDISGNTWIDGFLTLGLHSGVPVALLGRTTGNVVTDDISLGTSMALSGGGTLNSTIPFARYYYPGSVTSEFVEVDFSTQTRTIGNSSVFAANGDRINIDETGDYEVYAEAYCTTYSGKQPYIAIRVDGSTTIATAVHNQDDVYSSKATISCADIVNLSSTEYISLFLGELSSNGTVECSNFKLTVKKLE